LLWFLQVVPLPPPNSGMPDTLDKAKRVPPRSKLGTDIGISHCSILANCVAEEEEEMSRHAGNFPTSVLAKAGIQ